MHLLHKIGLPLSVAVFVAAIVGVATVWMSVEVDKGVIDFSFSLWKLTLKALGQEESKSYSDFFKGKDVRLCAPSKSSSMTLAKAYTVLQAAEAFGVLAVLAAAAQIAVGGLYAVGRLPGKVGRVSVGIAGGLLAVFTLLSLATFGAFSLECGSLCGQSYIGSTECSTAPREGLVFAICGLLAGIATTVLLVVPAPAVESSGPTPFYSKM